MDDNARKTNSPGHSADSSQGIPPAHDLVLVSEILPDQIPILPVAPRPVFPNMMMPLTFSGKRFIDAVAYASEKYNGILGLSLIKELNAENYMASKLYDVGTVMRIYRINQVDDDTIQVAMQGLQRFTRVRTMHEDPMIMWDVKYHTEEKPDDVQHLKPYIMAIMTSVKELLKINPLLQEQLKLLLSQISYDKPHIILDLVSTILTADPDKLQDLLETFDLMERSEKLLVRLKEEIELFHVQEKIKKQIDEKVGRQQKEFFLREQLKAIKKELGLEKDDKAQEIEKFEKRLKDLTLTSEAAGVVQEELEKLRMIESHSSEYHVSRNYLNELTLLPWGVFSEDNLDIKKAREILNDDHYGLDDVKKRILEFVSTIVKRGTVSGSIICLAGPPGVGKTSVGRSIANALGRKFYRFSVGGMRDEAEIKGHRRTYIGAMPGKIIQSLKQTKTANPVIMIDEIDKIGMSYQGDPASALLEVLDPEQNKDFLDHYLDVRFDLSNILFVTTANQLDTIPRPLLDRMEIINLAGYILDEKIEIARRYLIPRQITDHGLTDKEVGIGKPALKYIIDRYAREAGVRSLENQIKKIMRQVTLRQVEGDTARVVVAPKSVEEFLGKPIFTTEELYQKRIPGVALGLAWTAMGGATLYIEASAVKAKAKGFKQTGQLGDVMKESAEIAYSFMRALFSHDKRLAGFFDENFVHLHVPAGATPKDGPSAGITMALALYSLGTGRAVRKGVAMTGELTLTGKVLPIGGVREKTLAARRVNVKELIFPIDNRKDFDELPEYLRAGIKAHFVDYFSDVLKVVYK
ncbi:MAG: endopeptidase La [Deltaproteobacteria bacterium]|nr:endopeptidase La [Deltaproteobacteria bacterium]